MGFSRILSFKFPSNWSQTGKEKVLSFLAFFLRVLSFLAFCVEGFSGANFWHCVLGFVRATYGVFLPCLCTDGRENFVFGPLAPLPSLLFSSPLFSVVGLGFFLFFLALCALGSIVDGRCWPCTLPPLSPLSPLSSSPQADHHLLVFCLSFLHRSLLTFAVSLLSLLSCLSCLSSLLSCWGQVCH